MFYSISLQIFRKFFMYFLIGVDYFIYNRLY